MTTTILLILAVNLWLGSEQSQEDRFFAALSQIESGGDARAVGDNGKAVGEFQLWKIYVDDVNRIVGRKEFAYSDRFDRAKSRIMVTVYLRHYATQKRLSRPVTIIDLARIHLGGPNGWKKKCTVDYGIKFKSFYKGS